MLNKVEYLTSIGKFRSYRAVGQINFKKLNLIYGDNGGGKTTLTSIFRSLSSNNPAIIRSRISTNNTAPQAAQITQVGNPLIFHTFGTNGWTSTMPDIEIFDIHFVTDNIYSGFDFNDEHKKQLHQFVIGAQGVAIQNQIEQNKLAKTLSRQNQSAIELQLIEQVGNNLTAQLISSFLTLPQSQLTNIDERIAAAEAALASANANSVIQTLQLLSNSSKVDANINFTTIISDLHATSQSIQNDTLEELFSTHCQDLTTHSLDAPENWLQKGFKFIESKQIATQQLTCPFCKQSIDNNNEALLAYTSKFNTAFNSLVERLQNHLASIESFNIELVIQAIENTNSNNTNKYESWATYLPDITQPTFNIFEDASSFRTQFQNLKNTLQKKIQNPTQSIDASTATLFQGSIENINGRIDTYNQSIATYNTAITSFRASIQSAANAQIELDRLNRLKKRFENTIVSLCNDLSIERQNLKNLETAYTALSQQQQAAATTFFNAYQTRINHYLTNVFRTRFRIENVTHVAPQGRGTQSKIAYKLTLDGHDISFIQDQPFHVKQCLSEGDKSTIALAFFLSKLDIDPNQHNKILIFDDPLSSLDTNRRAYTIGIIRSLFQVLKQVVVLSHNEYFLNEIGKDIGVAQKSTLRITEDFVSNSSKIEECNLDDLVKIEYFKNIEALEAFRSSPDLALKDTVLGWLRNVLESHLRFKFYREIRSMSGQQTFGRLITFLDNSPAIFRDNLNRSSIISKLHQINGASWRAHHGDPTPDYAVLGVNPNSISVAELDNLIVDTLNLIYIQL